MENLIVEENHGSEENVSEEDLKEDIDPKQNLNNEKEKDFWDKIVLKNLVYLPKNFPKCKKRKYRVYEKKESDIINPYYLKCVNKQYQKR